MIETQTTQERVLLVGVLTPEEDPLKFDTLMDELGSLATTAGGEVVGRIVQKLPTPDRRTLVGKGKLTEIEREIDLSSVDLVITQNRLTPGVNAQLESALDVRVIDRTQLILDIFAMRARSREGKLQVEMAQYDYLLPRIIGKGLALSRQGGGIGTRGPGETQLETDRRHIRSRMHAIRRELDQVERHRDRTRQQRQSNWEYNIGLIGYTNAGKSTLFGQLTQSETYVQNQLFATLDPLTRQFKIDGHDAFILTDTVGFIEDLPTELIQAFKSTLEEIREMDLLLHVVDASHPAHHMHEETVLALLTDMQVTDIPILTVYNKKDLAPAYFTPTLYPNCVISAYDPADRERLKQAIKTICMEHSVPYHHRLPSDRGDLIAHYQQKTLLQSLEYLPELDQYELRGYQKQRHPLEEE